MQQQDDQQKPTVVSKITKSVTNNTSLKTNDTMDLECDGDLCYPKFF